jgi:hypothetical protein
VSADRSYEGRHAGQQLCAVIEFSRNVDAAWGKIESWKYDWLGIMDDGAASRR